MTITDISSPTSLEGAQETEETEPPHEDKKATLENAKGLIGGAVLIDALITHRYREVGARIEEHLLVERDRFEVQALPAIIVGTVSNIILFRTVDINGQEQLLGAWDQNLHFELALEDIE